MNPSDIHTVETGAGQLSYVTIPSEDGRVEIWARTPVTPEWTMIGTADDERAAHRTIQDAIQEAEEHLSGPSGQRLIMAGRRARMGGRRN